MATLPTNFAEVAVANGLTNPTSMDFSPDGRLWVLEQSGVVEVFHGGSSAGSVALTIPTSAIDTSGERGLLGIAFDPSYNINSSAPDYVDLYYTSTSTPDPHNRVSRFVVNNANPDHPTLSQETVLVDLDPLSTATNHNGGAIHFGPDGKLYVAVGDNNNGANAQSITTRLGKILRYNADGTIPTDNPSSFPGISGTTTGADRAIWAVGLRNPFTFTFQPGTGLLHINDVGLNSFEEIDVGKAGANYGWPLTEGKFDQASFPNFTEPYYSYAHGTAQFQGFAITGGAFYNPTTPGIGVFPASYDNDYFFADFERGWIDVIDSQTQAVSEFATNASGPVNLLVSSDGGLYYLARNTGNVFRVAYTANTGPTITQQPSGQVIVSGSSASFSVVASGSTPLTYQWQEEAVGATSFTTIAGANSSSYSVPSVRLADNGALFQVVVSNPFGSLTSSAAKLTVTTRAATPPASFDGSGKSNLAVYLPLAGAFAYRPSDGTADQVISFGIPGLGQTVPSVADYEGSGHSQVAAYFPSLGIYGIRPTSGPDQVFSFGIPGAGQSIPVPADYDGDGKADVAVYLTAVGAFGVRPSSGGADQITGFGIAGGGKSIPAPGDYDGDGKADLAVYLPGFGEFAYRPSSGGPDQIIPFGLAGTGRSIPIPGDYDGSGKTELAVYLPEFGLFAYRPASGAADVLTRFGATGDGTIPVPGDYDGSGRTEIAVFDPNYGSFAYRPASGAGDKIIAFGSAGVGLSIPVAAPAGSTQNFARAASIGQATSSGPLGQTTSTVTARSIPAPASTPVTSSLATSRRNPRILVPQLDSDRPLDSA